jgi:hypothetical protein
MIPSLTTAFVTVACALFTHAAETAPAADTATNAPTIITAGADWVPLRAELEIEPGSALDFSQMGFVDAPAGKHGRIIARADGQFAFADSPETPRRFYGVNLCFGAHYLTGTEPERLSDRLMRLGYNTVRIHHYERDLTQGTTNTTELNPAKLEQFDALTAALISRGMYLTTDLFVSRGVPYRQVGIDRPGQIPMDTYKILVPVHAGTFEDWKTFTRNLLGHVNPHTKRRYADEPALAWLSMINEGNFGNFYRDLQTIPEWKQAWNRWLARHYPQRQALAAAWGNELRPEENPSDSTVALPPSLSGSGIRVRDTIAFLSETESEMIQKMKAFLREELGCHALISNANSWTYFATDQATRGLYDYVDDHFYVDHPRFLQQSWRLPSHCPNTSPLTEGAAGGRSKSFTRLLDKPFTITEYNYSGPGRFRGVGGILTGAMGALQGWAGIWRFAYSHSREALFTPSRMGYFDLASDPLSQAAERASLCLFVRGDLRPSTHSVAFTMTATDLAHPANRIPPLAPRWHWLAWVNRLGTRVVTDPAVAAQHDLIVPLAWQTPATAFDPGKVFAADPYKLEDAALWTAVREHGLVSAANRTEPGRRLFESEAGQVLIDAPRGALILDTPRTAGGFAPAGQSIIAAAGGVQIKIEGADATVWVSALDPQPIRSSQRLLVTHLTDLQNTGIRYAEPARQTLLEWGSLPHLVHAGRAEVSIQLAATQRFHVWALAPGGRRLREVPAQTDARSLTFTADVAADAATGARMLYELAQQ